MHSRRNFLIQGSLTTTALLALKPFETLAHVTSPFMGLNSSTASLLFLHTAHMDPSLVQSGLLAIKESPAQVICLHSGKEIYGEIGHSLYDTSNPEKDRLSAMGDNFKIINKKGLRIGIINAKPGDRNVIEKTESLSVYLKNDKKCHLIVCLSQLGYKNANTPDDLSLAKQTTHLDIIIGGHQKNFYAYPVIKLNHVDKEVIIHSASENPLGYGIINIDFDDQRQKKSIRFTA